MKGQDGKYNESSYLPRENRKSTASLEAVGNGSTGGAADSSLSTFASPDPS